MVSCENAELGATIDPTAADRTLSGFAEEALREARECGAEQDTTECD